MIDIFVKITENVLKISQMTFSFCLRFPGFGSGITGSKVMKNEVPFSSLSFIFYDPNPMPITIDYRFFHTIYFF